METMENLKLSQLRKIYSFADDISEDPREIISGIVDETDDFTVGDYRFIREDAIDQIQCDELESDPYILGCFTEWFIADNTDLSLDIVQALQKAGSYDAIGQHIIDNNYLKAIQDDYSSQDGYGHHFATYDSETLEDLLTLGYYVFRVN